LGELLHMLEFLEPKLDSITEEQYKTLSGHPDRLEPRVLRNFGESLDGLMVRRLKSEYQDTLKIPDLFELNIYIP
jgi:hypothetical protein